MHRRTFSGRLPDSARSQPWGDGRWSAYAGPWASILSSASRPAQDRAGGPTARTAAQARLKILERWIRANDHPHDWGRTAPESPTPAIGRVRPKWIVGVDSKLIDGGHATLESPRLIGTQENRPVDERPPPLGFPDDGRILSRRLDRELDRLRNEADLADSRGHRAVVVDVNSDTGRPICHRPDTHLHAELLAVAISPADRHGPRGDTRHGTSDGKSGGYIHGRILAYRVDVAALRGNRGCPPDRPHAPSARERSCATRTRPTPPADYVSSRRRWGTWQRDAMAWRQGPAECWHRVAGALAPVQLSARSVKSTSRTDRNRCIKNRRTSAA